MANEFNVRKGLKVTGSANIQNTVTINGTLLFNKGGEQTLDTGSAVQFGDITLISDDPTINFDSTAGDTSEVFNITHRNHGAIGELFQVWRDSQGVNSEDFAIKASNGHVFTRNTLSVGTDVDNGYDLFVSGTANITNNLTVTGSSYFVGDNTYEGILTDDIFNPGFGGSGWRVDTNASAEFQDLTVRGTFNVYELLVQQLRGTNGSVIIANTGKVDSASLIAGSQYYLTFDTGSSYGHSFQANDIALAQRLANDNSSIIQSFIQIDSVENAGALTASLLSGSTPSSGYDYVRIGNTTDADRQGHIYLTADDTNSPFIGVRDGVDAYTDFTTGTGSVEKVRVGKLDGVTSANFGVLTGFGLWASGSVFLEGGINATNGTIAGFTITGDRLENGSNFFIEGGVTGDQFFISASNWNVKANGNMTGSSVLLDGGIIGGFTITSTELTATNIRIDSADAVISVGTGIDGYNETDRIYIDGDGSRMSIGTGFTYASDTLTIDGNASIGGFTINSTEISASGLVMKSNGQITGSNAFIQGFISSSAGEIGGWTIEPDRLSDVQGGFGLILSGSANGGEISMQSASEEVLSIAPSAPLPTLTAADAVFSASDTDINFGDTNLSGDTVQSPESSASPGINNFIPEKIARYKFRITGSVSGGGAVDWTAITQGSGSSTNNLWEDINTETGTDADYGTNYTQSINTTGYSEIRLVLSASATLPDGADYTATAENIDMLQYKNRTVINSNGIYLAVAPNEFLTLAGGGSGGTTTVDVNWGEIGGTLSNQTDLQNALDGKADTNESVAGAIGGTLDDTVITTTAWTDQGFVTVDGSDELLIYNADVPEVAKITVQDIVDLSGGDNFYVTGAFFNTTNGELTLHVDGASDVTEDLDGRYALTSGDVFTNGIEIQDNNTHLTFTETDNSNKQWHLEGSSGNFAIAETGVEINTIFNAGGGVDITNIPITNWGLRLDSNGSNFSGFWSSNENIHLYLREQSGSIGVLLKSGFSERSYIQGDLSIGQTGGTEALDIVGNIAVGGDVIIDNGFAIENASDSSAYIQFGGAGVNNETDDIAIQMGTDGELNIGNGGTNDFVFGATFQCNNEMDVNANVDISGIVNADRFDAYNIVQGDYIIRGGDGTPNNIIWTVQRDSSTNNINYGTFSNNRHIFDGEVQSQGLDSNGIVNASAGNSYRFRDRGDLGTFENNFSIGINAPNNVVIAIDSNNNNADDTFFQIVKNDGAFGAPTEIYRLGEDGDATMDGTHAAADHIDSSDERIKSDIKPISNALEALRNINAYTFLKDGRESVGFIAQEVEQFTKNVVKIGEGHGYDDFRTMRLMGMQAYNTVAIKELDTENKKLKKENKELRERLEKLEQIVLGDK